MSDCVPAMVFPWAPGTLSHFHGNAGNRAAPFRMSSYNYITSRIHANVLAIDYRGFGDSKAPGVSPSEEGLVKDAWAAWDWVTSSKQNSNAKLGHAADSGGIGRDVILMGQSMGTGVASRLALELTEAGSPPQAVVLIAPYASLRSLVLDYQLGGIIPVMGPLKRMPGIDSLIDNYLITHFNSTSALHKLYFDTKVATPRPVPHLVLIHATKDDVIPFHHSERLFDALTTAELGSIARRGTSSQVDNLETHEIDGFGKIVHLDLQNTHTPQALSGATDGGEWDGHRERSATVTLIRTHWGGHNTGFSEGVADYVRQLLGWTDRT
ncbi:hypothetical protein OC861_005931 [Tilletia horrida]|nr:hypothetical protein OC861_005931 [Tilletia horrida]